MFKNKTILVIGGTGSIGQVVVKQLLNYSPKVIRIFSRDEFKQYEMAQVFEQNSNIRFFLGDIRDRLRVLKAMNKVDVVFNFAALKQVPLCEYNPFEAVKTNVLGTQNVIDCAIEAKVDKVIYTSSDKAVSPTNTMGATKLLAERMIAAADYTKGGKTPVFAAVRFGNVINTRGSVIPLWTDQIRETKEITLTDETMTRFMMSKRDAAKLVFQAAKIATGGEVFVLKMPVVKMGDLAKCVIDIEAKELGISANEINTKIIGLRAGEKLYEELLSLQESQSAIEYNDMFAILPHHKLSLLQCDSNKACYKEYSSSNERCLNLNEIQKMIMDSNDEKSKIQEYSMR